MGKKSEEGWDLCGLPRARVWREMVMLKLRKQKEEGGPEKEHSERKEERTTEPRAIETRGDHRAYDLQVGRGQQGCK